MSTRAVITFKNNGDEFHVYQHCDGSPEDVGNMVKSAEAYAWDLPRFEASDFAAAYVRACKDGAGNIRFSRGPEYHGDLAYSYEVTCDNGTLKILTTRSPGNP